MSEVISHDELMRRIQQRDELIADLQSELTQRTADLRESRDDCNRAHEMRHTVEAELRKVRAALVVLSDRKLDRAELQRLLVSPATTEVELAIAGVINELLMAGSK